MARVLRASAAITKSKHPRGYQDFTRDEMDAIMRKPLSTEDYKKADRIMLLLMQPQVKTLLDSQAKNAQGMSTLPDKFINWPIIGPDNPTKTQVNSGSLTPADLPTRTNYNPKDVEKDTQWQNGAAEQHVHALKDALELTMPNDSGHLDFSDSVLCL